MTEAAAPDPWEFSENAHPLGPPPDTPGYRTRPVDLGLADPAEDAMEERQGNPHYPRYQFITFAIGLGFDPECGRGRHLIAPPSRIDELIAQSVWEPNGLFYLYNDQRDGLKGYGKSTLQFTDQTRSTQCQSSSMFIDKFGRVGTRAPFPTIQCMIFSAPEYVIWISIPARMHSHLGEILTRIDQDARLLVDAERSD